MILLLLVPIGAAATAAAAVLAALDARQKERDAVISVRALRYIAPGLSAERAAELQPLLVRAVRRFGITDPKDLAAFLAQTAFESDGFNAFEEYASGKAYEGRQDLGNTQPGDGMRYKGRGPIQLTGRANYRAAGTKLKLDLEGNPAQVATPAVGFLVAAWYWWSRGLSALGSQGTAESFRLITVKVNGSDKTVPQRTPYWLRAKSALGVAS
ncbi:MAG TPA: glycoside hydrolase family 19 protein [Archangium sp.]|uniref:glycoside hydrolase family 19 protein n=1 Tax=Archangium sp. TaxID=1872627 RepID=UPI002E3326CE|nr:glycoside hydrolase family 19 protein [Archangium sp.]HEX5744825.1 glycoside hydrolase family 19 protein [Archangium sp.]